jgi:hypothetical protein
MALIEISGPISAAPRALRLTSARDRRHVGFGSFGWRVLGAALLIASFGIWAVPAAFAAPSLLSIKLGLSVAMLTSGLGIMVGSLSDQG